MSYQIKSTPFFRRLVTTSKRNGQLQMLKEEYERIKEFNERTIEMRMRQVRLKRLFREIEEIKESAGHVKRRRLATDKMKTIEEMRMETLVKAKELGKEYSRMNALAAPRYDNSLANSSSTFTREEGERKARINKRIKYGNEISRTNIQKIALSHPKGNLRPDSQDALKNKERLLQRISYGNSRSSLNMNRRRNMKRKTKSEPQESPSQMLANMQPEPAEEETHTRDQKVYKTFEELQKSKMLMQRDTSMPSEGENHSRARQRWRKLASSVTERSDTLEHRIRANRRAQLRKTPFNEEYELRNISNNTHLPQLGQLDAKLATEHSEGSEDPTHDERLLSVEPLNRPASTQQERTSSTTNTVVSAFLNSKLSASDQSADESSSIKHTVQQYVKMFEPIAREVAKKEVLEYGVNKFRSIFEHQAE